MKPHRVYRIAVHIVPRAGLLDPQGNTITSALYSLGFKHVHSVHVGRHIIIETEAPDALQAETTVQEMCEKLLANPVTEDFEITSAVPA
ncbi:MAG: phosphoribosylformylglycinamidine synthase subunit PurS [Gemmatimonadaceae bacterium]